MKTETCQHVPTRALRRSLLLAGLTTLLCVPTFAQPATLLAYWNFNDASNPAQSVATFGGFVGVFTNNPAGDPANNPIYTGDGGGYSGQAGDRALDFGLNGSFRLMRCTDIAAVLNAAAAGDSITVTFRQKWNTTPAGSSSFWFTSPSSTGNWRGFQSHCPNNSSGAVYFDTAGCCTAGANRLNGNVSVNFQQWHNFFYVKNGLDKQVIVDGVVALSGTGANPLPTDFTEVLVGGAYVVGAPTQTVANNMRGVIDDFAIWQGTLSSAQIILLNSGMTPDQVGKDTDSDGMPDGYEDLYAFDKNNPADATQDADGDTLTNLQECLKGTNPRLADTDDDGLSDGVETGTGYWTSATDTGTNPLDPDTDDDLLLDGVENATFIFQDANHTGTFPHTFDSDGDGYGDGAEVALGSSPVDSSSTPNRGTGSRILAYWDFNTDTVSTQAVDQVHSLRAYFTNGVVYTADNGGFTGKPGDRALDFGTSSAQRTARSSAIAPYLQAAAVTDLATGNGDQISISFWQKWSTVPVASSTFWVVSPSAGPTSNYRGMQSHLPNGGAAGTIYFDTGGTVLDTQRTAAGTPPGLNWEKWHHFAFIKNMTEKQLWIDGRMITNTPFALPLLTDFTELILGANYATPNNQLLGLLDDFAAYGSALTPAQIEALAGGMSPMLADQATTDSDSDGMPDWYEDIHGLAKNNPADAAQDTDGDGSTNLQEYQRKTIPTNPDTDGDGFRDGVESNTGTWVSLSNTGTDPLNPDTDGDGLPDGAERNTGVFVSAADAGTNPLATDTDADLYDEMTELLLGSDPVNPSSVPVTVGGTNLLAYWDFNDASAPSQALDRIHGFVGVFEDDATYAGDGSGRTGQAGDWAVDFGTNGTARVRNAAGQWLRAIGPVDAVTVSFWEKWTVPTASSFAFFGISPSVTEGGNRGISAHCPWGGGTVYWDTAGSGGIAGSRVSVNAATIAGFIPEYANIDAYYVNTWRHFAFVKNGGTKQIWMDGVPVAEGTGAALLPADFTQFLMGNIWNANNAFRGLMDDFAIYGSALDTNNIVALAQGASPIDFSMPVLPPTVTIGRSGSDVVLSWTGTGHIVQTNSDLTNPAGWADVPGATTSPFTQAVSPTETRYFRLKKQ